MILAEKLYANIRRIGKKDGTEEEVFYTGEIQSKNDGDIIVLSLNLRLTQLPHVYARTIDTQKGVWIDITLDGEIKGVLARKQFNPFWSEPCFEKDLSMLPDNIQNMLIRINNEYIAVLPVINKDYNVTIMASDSKDILRFCLTKCYDGAFELKGELAVLAKAKKPYDAVKKAYKYASENGIIKTHMRDEKTLNPMYNGLGWCTWDAFYREVCEESIFQKLEEFKQKNIPIKWVVIDDGWMQVSDKEQFALMSFKEDKNKFPNGLKACVDKMKNDYGIEQVGVWHTITGYWFGIEKYSELYYEQKENLTETNSGLFIPDGEKAYDFFGSWYEYLKSQGIDFVKIDGQGNSLEFFTGKKDCVIHCTDLQKAVDKAVNDYFSGNVINCMAMNNINVHNRPYTSLSRNSDDFLPAKPESFVSHVMQNAYNAVFHSNLFYCDYDMWQSYDVTAKLSSILRAVSGGPIYLSDAIGKTDDKYIRPLLDDNGNLILCNDCALPTLEHIFEDPQNSVLKLINKKGNGYVMAIFNLSGERKKITICLNETFEKHMAYSYYEKKFYTDIPFVLELDAFDADIINFYPIDEECIYTGDVSKYISAGGEESKCTIKECILTKDICAQCGRGEKQIGLSKIVI